MSEVWCYAYAEDALSCAVMRRLVDYCNESTRAVPLRFFPGFPENKRGCSPLRAMIGKLSAMCQAGIPAFVLTDLDQIECAPKLLREWFGLSDEKPVLPDNFLFRVAEREVETWLLADRRGLSSFLEISAANFSADPDSLTDPKQHLLNVIQAKGRKKWHRQLLPSANAHVGPDYNSKFCEFVEIWDVARASRVSNSLQRAITAINQFQSF